MKRTLLSILTAVLAFGLVGCGDEGKSMTTTEGNATCDLNAHACVASLKGKEIKFDVTPKPLYPMSPFTLRVTGLGEGYKALNVRIYGLNMDMGVVRAELERRGSTYMGQIVLSSCVTEVMNYRMEIYDGDKPLGVFIDFDLKG